MAALTNVGQGGDATKILNNLLDGDENPPPASLFDDSGLILSDNPPQSSAVGSLGEPEVAGVNVRGQGDCPLIEPDATEQNSRRMLQEIEQGSRNTFYYIPWVLWLPFEVIIILVRILVLYILIPSAVSIAMFLSGVLCGGPLLLWAFGVFIRKYYPFIFIVVLAFTPVVATRMLPDCEDCEKLFVKFLVLAVFDMVVAVGLAVYVYKVEGQIAMSP